MLTDNYTYTRTDILLDIQNISVSYDGTPILKNLSASVRDIVRPDVAQGQIVALLGPSGIGKTTLFRVMAGLMSPDEGRVLVGAKQEVTKPGRIGVVAQNYPLLNHRTVKGNLIRAGKLAGLNSAEADTKALNYLAEFNLLDHAHKYPVQLSGGQRQRVAIAQQLICSEHYIILDEPFSGLDVNSLAKVQLLLQKVAQTHEEVTIIVVTHDVTAAVCIADTIWLMGRDRTPDGAIIPGAKIMQEIDLIELGLTWRPDILDLPASGKLIRDIKHRFPTL